MNMNILYQWYINIKHSEASVKFIAQKHLCLQNDCNIFGIVKKGGTIGMHVSFSQDKGMG